MSDRSGTAPAASADEPPGLVVRGARKRFGEVVALDDVSLIVEAGEFATLLGPSGCGKTTLLRILAGLELADAGQVSLGGRIIDGLPAHERPVNTVFQSYALFPHLDVFDNVAFGLRSRHRPKDEIERDVAEVLALVRLDGLDRRRIEQLSGGQKQRVALARALVNEPELLLLDEPMSALDAKLRSEVQLELRRVQREHGTTFLLVTHDQDEAMTVSDRIFVMHGGRIEQSGAPSEIYERPRTRFVAEFLGAANLIAVERSGTTEVSGPFGRLVLDAPPPWESGTLAIRPERIRIEAASPVNRLRVTVTDSVFRGDHVDLTVAPGPLRVRVAPAAPIETGTTLELSLPPEHLVPLHG
ncbi:MAG: ABC transporter ATP-binding protein [bacterium]